MRVKWNEAVGKYIIFQMPLRGYFLVQSPTNYVLFLSEQIRIKLLYTPLYNNEIIIRQGNEGQSVSLAEKEKAQDPPHRHTVHLAQGCGVPATLLQGR
jgi:hypothetical protein